MSPFLKLIRYKNLLMVALTMFLTKYSLIEYSLAKSYLSNIDFILLSSSILLITAGGYIINNIFDIHVDRINKPEQLLIGNSISKKKAWIIYGVLTILGLVLGIYISIDKVLYSHIWYFIAVSISLFFYSKYLQKTMLLGNLLVALLCGLVIYLVYSFDFRVNKDDLLKTITINQIHNIQNGRIAIKFYIIFSVLTTLIREIIKDIEDINGDYNMGYTTLPILLGKKRTRNFVLFISVLTFIYLALFTSVFYGFGLYLITVSLSLILMTFLYFIFKLWSATTKKQFHNLSTVMKFMMLVGILSMGLFKFI